jgi:hypothetical protein
VRQNQQRKNKIISSELFEYFMFAEGVDLSAAQQVHIRREQVYTK